MYRNHIQICLKSQIKYLCEFRSIKKFIDLNSQRHKYIPTYINRQIYIIIIIILDIYLLIYYDRTTQINSVCYAVFISHKRLLLKASRLIWTHLHSAVSSYFSKSNQIGQCLQCLRQLKEEDPLAIMSQYLLVYTIGTYLSLHNYI